MTKKRWIYDNEGNAHEAIEPQALPMYDGLLWNDKLYQNDGDPRYNSRQEHRAYMRDNDLSMHSDYTLEWEKSAKARADFYSGVDPSRRDDIARAIHNYINKRRSS